MEAKGSNTTCPVCKSAISQETLIPIYTKEENSNNTNRFKIPNRPKGQRTESTNDVLLIHNRVKALVIITLLLVLWALLDFSLSLDSI